MSEGLYNQHGTKGVGTLVENWVEERALHELTGQSRAGVKTLSLSRSLSFFFVLFLSSFRSTDL